MKDLHELRNLPLLFLFGNILRLAYFQKCQDTRPLFFCKNLFKIIFSSD